MSKSTETPKTGWTAGPVPREIPFQAPLERGSGLKQLVDGVKELAATSKNRKKTKPGSPYSGLAATSNGETSKAAKAHAKASVKNLDLSGVSVTATQNVDAKDASKYFQGHW